MYKVDVNTINAVLNYLGSKPYAEVVELINALQQGEVQEDTGEEV